MDDDFSDADILEAWNMGQQCEHFAVLFLNSEKLLVLSSVVFDA